MPLQSAAHRSFATQRTTPLPRTPPDPALTITRLNSLRDIDEHCDTLLGDAARPSLFESLPWWQLLANTINTDQFAIGAYCVSDAQGPMLLVATRASAGNRAELSSLTNYYSPFAAPLWRKGADDRLDPAINALCQYWRKERWHSIDLGPMDGHHPILARFHKALAANGFSTFRYFRYGGWHLEADGLSYADYLRRLPKKLRHSIKRMPQKVAQTFTCRERRYPGEGDLERMIRDFVEIYNDSWRKPEPFPEFLPSLMRSAAEQGWLRLIIIDLDDEPAAAQLWLHAESVASIYKVAYREKYAPFSLGTILTARMIEQALGEPGIDSIDFLSGDDPYKRNWMSHRKVFYSLRAHNRSTPVGAAHAAIEATKQLMKRFAGRNTEPVAGKSRLKPR